MNDDEALVSKKRYPQVLLTGNGINQLNGGVSWNDFLREIATKEEIVNGNLCVKDLECPEPLKAILVTDDHVDVAMKNYCDKIAFKSLSSTAKNIYYRLLRLGFDDILTTNYTYELEMAAIGEAEANTRMITSLMRYTGEIRRAESKYLLHTYNSVLFENCLNRIWHIHGEARKPESTVLGHYYYGNLLFKIKELLNNRKYGIHRETSSWVDAFILGDVYVLGFGYGFSETDLWWLLNRKAREKSATGKVYFYDAEPARYDEKHDLLNMLKRESDGEKVVEIINCGYKNKVIIENGVEKYRLDGAYEDFYNVAISDIEEKVKQKTEVK